MPLGGIYSEMSLAIAFRIITTSLLVGMPSPLTSAFALPPSNANGDLNGDGGLTKEDTVVLSNWLSGDTDAAPADWQAADYNHDRKLNAVDLSMMLRALSE